MLLATNLFATINGIKEERAIKNFVESSGGLPMKIDKYLTQIDMFIKRTKEKKVELINIYSFKSNISFDEKELFYRYKKATLETYCENKWLFGDDQKIRVIKYRKRDKIYI